MKQQEIIYTKNLPEYQYPTKEVFRPSGRLRGDFYERELLALQYELVKLQKWVVEEKKRVLILFEGMDTAGKSSTIKAFNTFLNPRKARIVALPKPTQEERGEWYFQRYLKRLPHSEEMVFFDRSWYNRAGIERVFSFCTKEEHQRFYAQVNGVEEMLVDDGIYLFKFYLNITHKTQKKRMKERERNPLKNWKLSEMDYRSMKHYKHYVKLRQKMFKKSGTAKAPWVCFDANDKKRARLNAIRYLLMNIPYEGKDTALLEGVDEKIVLFYHQENEKK